VAHEPEVALLHELRGIVVRADESRQIAVQGSAILVEQQREIGTLGTRNGIGRRGRLVSSAAFGCNEARVAWRHAETCGPEDGMDGFHVR
jgi:hypothetical protein